MLKIIHFQTFPFQAHIHTFRGRILETILSLRFFIFQYGVVYHMKASQENTALSVCLCSSPDKWMWNVEFCDKWMWNFMFQRYCSFFKHLLRQSLYLYIPLIVWSSTWTLKDYKNIFFHFLYVLKEDHVKNGYYLLNLTVVTQNTNLFFCNLNTPTTHTQVQFRYRIKLILDWMLSIAILLLVLVVLPAWKHHNTKLKPNLVSSVSIRK